jgi:hypothetical protein
MKQFTIRDIGLNPEENQIWREAGFCLIKEPWFPSSEKAPPELIWLADCAIGGKFDDRIAEELRTSFPKLFFVQHKAAALMPDHWQAYAQQMVRMADADWIVGSKLEEPLPPAVAEYMAQQKTADLAAVVYIVILESVFRETAEWCGHMSSVVGHM